ncbi:bifunctional metallophosphatase/5'-nucleotidase [Halospeciosus flavus]|uniref:Bifunctional metallophosphatase/5'-nucleotidase n=1 Tax=Halospeciosus flavus TaxID=3032283 RepID=A0ABD5Z9C6_9EURY|nr:5'-nucleotidase C-terminal domain-containing protein [Halospeciosus flavus]
MSDSPLRHLHYSDVENAYDRPDRIGRLTGTIRSLDGPDAVVAGTGDTTSPGVLPLVTEGRQALDFYEGVGTAVETFGNHDFDFGPDATRDVVADSPQTWVSANAWDADGGRFAADEGVVPRTVVEREGVRVGFVGVTAPETGDLNPMATDVDFSDPVAAAREQVAALREEGVDYVVVLSHLGTPDEELAVELDVDVVLGGHLHAETRERVAGTLIVRPGVNGGIVHEVTLDGGEPTVERHAVDEGPMADDVADALRDRMAAAGLDEVVATVDEPIERTEATVFRGESRIGNFVADAYRWVADADVGLQNSGGIREGEPLDGDVTVADLMSVVPFEEDVIVGELTGRELLTLLRQSSGAVVSFGQADWWHGHVSGIELVWDHATDELVEARVGGDPVDLDATYTVATTDYLFHSEQEFPLLDDEHRGERFYTQYDVLVDYAREVGIDAEIEGRIVRRSVESA